MADHYSGRRIEVRPSGTYGEPSCRADLIDADGAHLTMIPARYEREETPDGTLRYVVLDVDAVQTNLWGQPGTAIPVAHAESGQTKAGPRGESVGVDG